MVQTQADWHDDLLAVLPKVRRVAYALTRNMADADDLLQSTVERALANQDRFEPGTALDRWMVTICRNLYLSTYRTKARRGPHVAFDEMAIPPENDAEGNMEHRLALAQVMAALDTLNEDQRQIIILSAVDNRSYKEIAEMLDIPVGTVMSRLSRARRTLADRMDQPERGQEERHADHR